MTNNDPDRLVTSDDAAELSGRSVVTIRHWGSLGRLTVRRYADNGGYLFRLSDVLAIAEVSRKRPDPTPYPEGYISPAMAANRLGVSVGTFYGCMKRGKVKGYPAPDGDEHGGSGLSGDG